MKLTMDQKRAITGKLAAKYRGCSSRRQRSRILDQVVELTGYHRKYAAWLLRHYGTRRLVSVGDNEAVLLVVGQKNKRRPTVKPRKYDRVVQEQLAFIWEAFGLCGKRLKAAMRDFIPTLIRQGHFQEGSEVHQKLQQISPATIDRLLAPLRAKDKRRGSCLTKPGTVVYQGFVNSKPWRGFSYEKIQECICRYGDVPWSADCLWRREQWRR